MLKLSSWMTLFEFLKAIMMSGSCFIPSKASNDDNKLQASCCPGLRLLDRCVPRDDCGQVNNPVLRKSTSQNMTHLTPLDSYIHIKTRNKDMRTWQTLPLQHNLKGVPSIHFLIWMFLQQFLTHVPVNICLKMIGLLMWARSYFINNIHKNRRNILGIGEIITY